MIIKPELNQLTKAGFTKLLANQTCVLRVMPEDIKRETKIHDDLRFDDLDIIELIMNLEDEYSIEIPDSIGFDNYITVGEYWDMVCRLISVEQQPTDTF